MRHVPAAYAGAMEMAEGRFGRAAQLLAELLEYDAGLRAEAATLPAPRPPLSMPTALRPWPSWPRNPDA